MSGKYYWAPCSHRYVTERWLLLQRGGDTHTDYVLHEEAACKLTLGHSYLFYTLSDYGSMIVTQHDFLYLFPN